MGYNDDEGGTWDWEVTIFKLSGDELDGQKGRLNKTDWFGTLS